MELDEATRQKLADAGFDTDEKIQAATDDELRAVQGIGPATLAKIRGNGSAPDSTTTTVDQLASAPAPQPEHQHDETVPGGRYLVNGVLVNANGEPIKE